MGLRTRVTKWSTGFDLIIRARTSAAAAIYEANEGGDRQAGVLSMRMRTSESERCARHRISPPSPPRFSFATADPRTAGIVRVTERWTLTRHGAALDMTN
jgi:hypothetical protein